MPTFRTDNAPPAPQAEVMDAAPQRLTIARLEQWVRQAQPNAQLVYGHGAMVCEAAPGELRERVMQLAERGWLTPHFRRGRSGDPSQHLVMRTHRPFLKGSTL